MINKSSTVQNTLNSRNLTMSPNEAKSIIEALANGVDPETGEVLSAQSVFNNPQVIRALFVATKALDSLVKKEKREKTLPDNAGKSWSESEDSELLTAYDSRHVVKDIAVKHGRTEGSIVARLVRLGRIIKK